MSVHDGNEIKCGNVVVEGTALSSREVEYHYWFKRVGGFR